MSSQPISAVPEHEITQSQAGELAVLLDRCFPSMFDGRTYFKQLPHFRLLAIENERILGQAGIDCRIINVGGSILRIYGIIDLCVLPERQGQGIGTQLLRHAEAMAAQSSRDFLVLMADRHDLYLRNGFSPVEPAITKWLAIEERESVTLIERDMSHCFLAKPVGTAQWPAGPIDMLGYLF